MNHLTLGAAFLAAALSQSEPKVPFVAPSAQVLSVKLLAEPSSYDLPTADRFTTVAAEGRCSTTVPRAIDVNLRWSVERAGIRALRIDISELRDGFATGRYLTSGARPPSERRLVFDGARPGLYYYWRLLAETSEGWIVSGSGRFDAPICAVDMEEAE